MRFLLLSGQLALQVYCFNSHPLVSSLQITVKQTLMDCDLPFLPQEIITNILKRLPVKSLIRFHCVCKHWKNLIKTPSFIQEHLHNSTQQNPSLLIQHVGRYDPYYLFLLDCKIQFREVESPPLLDSLGYISILGSSNGLLCLADHRVRPPAPLLWNPATREVRQVPVTLDAFPFSWHFGFGFSPIINDYMIVRISLLAMGYVVQIYSLSAGSWRNIQSNNIEDVHILHHGVTVNGVMFWNGFRSDDDDGTDVIVSFDTVSEVFTLASLPLPLSHLGVKLELAVYNDKLAIISHPGIVNTKDSYIYFGVLEEGVIGSSGERWSLRRKYIHDCYPFDLHAATIWKNEIVCIDFELPRHIGKTEGEKENAEPKFGLYLINVTTYERKLFVIPKRPNYCARVFNYVESLVPIGNIVIEEA